MSSNPTPKPRRSLRGRLMAALLIPLAILLLVGGAGSYGLAQYFADRVYDGWLFDSVNSLALEVDNTPKGPFVDMPAATQRLFEWDVMDTTYFRILGAKKGLLAGRPDMPPLGGDIDPYRGIFLSDLLADLRSIFSDQPDWHGGALIYDGDLDGQDVRVARLDLPERKFGEKITVEVAETTRKRQALAGVILLCTLIPQLFLTVAVGVAMRRAVRHGLMPLQLIAARLGKRNQDVLSPIAGDDAPREIELLTRSLNDLLARLRDAQSAQRRFIANVAHQLRTPLTDIKLQVQELRRESTFDGINDILPSLEGSADRAVRLSNQLLSLARAEIDSGYIKPLNTLDLATFVEETGARWAPRALAAGIEMQFFTSQECVLVRADEDLLTEAIGNLIDNAIKYHEGSGTVALSVSNKPSPTITVEDSGPGIAPEMRDTMLQRFARGARGEGTGLGLPITLEIARLHRAELVLDESTNNGGLRVQLIFPALAAGAIHPA